MIGDLTINIHANTSRFISPLQVAQKKLEGFSDEATIAKLSVDTISRSLLSVSSAANFLGLASTRLAALTGFAGAAASGFGILSTGIGLAGGFAFKTASAIKLLLIPLEGLQIALSVVIAPFRWLISLMGMLTRAAFSILKPLLQIALFAFRVKIAIMGLGIQFRLIARFMAMLSPQMRILVLGLTALGLAGRAGTLAMGVMSAAMRTASVVALSFVNPLAALRLVAMSTSIAITRLTLRFFALSKAITVFAVKSALSGMKSLSVAALVAAASIGGKLVGALMSAARWAGLIGAGIIGWGIKLASDAEQAEVAFTTMLKSADAAKSVLQELEDFAASTPFQLKDLRDGAKQLLNAQVPTDQLTGKLRILGDIAAGTGKPLLDFVRIFSKIKSTGKVSLESLNQLAERGVPIYSSLQKELGVTRTEMLSMISKGEVGFNNINNALTGMATGAGVFAGGMAAQSQTIAGLFSTLKDNVSFAAREMGMAFSEAFDFKGFMASSITFFQSLRDKIKGAMPYFYAIADVARAAFSAVWEAGTVAISAISGAMGVTSGNIGRLLMETLAIFEWMFGSWPDIAQLVFMKIGLFAVVAFNQIIYFLSVVVPATLTWFADNFTDIFYTATDYVLTIFINLGKNIRAIWAGIVSFISGNGFNVDFTPLTEGFQNSIKEMPKIPERVIGETERMLSASVGNLESKVAGSLQRKIEKNMKLLEGFGKVENIAEKNPIVADKIEAGNEGGGGGEGEGGGQGQKKALGLMERGSSEAFKAILGGQNKGQVAEQKKTNKILAEVARNTKAGQEYQPAFAMQGAV